MSRPRALGSESSYETAKCPVKPLFGSPVLTNAMVFSPRLFNARVSGAAAHVRGIRIASLANRRVTQCGNGPSGDGRSQHAVSLLQNRPARYLLSVLAVSSAFGLRLILIPLTGTGAPFVFFFAAVMVTSLLAGAGPGLVALLFSLPLAAYTFVRAGYPLSQAISQSLLFGVDGLVVVYLTFLMKQGRESALEANRQLRRANEELKNAEARTHELIELAPD